MLVYSILNGNVFLNLKKKKINKASRRKEKVETPSVGFSWLGRIHAIRESTPVQ